MRKRRIIRQAAAAAAAAAVAAVSCAPVYAQGKALGEWLTYTVYTSGESNPATGTEAPTAVTAVILLGIALLIRRQRK